MSGVRAKARGPRANRGTSPAAGTASRGLPALIGVNKMDLDVPGPTGEPSLARTIFADYEPIYPVFYLGVKSGAGLNELRAALARGAL